MYHTIHNLGNGGGCRVRIYNVRRSSAMTPLGSTTYFVLRTGVRLVPETRIQRIYMTMNCGSDQKTVWDSTGTASFGLLKERNDSTDSASEPSRLILGASQLATGRVYQAP